MFNGESRKNTVWFMYPCNSVPVCAISYASSKEEKDKREKRRVGDRRENCQVFERMNVSK